MILLQRVYETNRADSGHRFLVDRLWPRGIKKNALRMDTWLKEAAPSTKLREWFHHDKSNWSEFKKRYFAELDSRPESWQPLLAAARKGSVTLLYGSRDTKHNNAIALREFLEKKLKS